MIMKIKTDQPLIQNRSAITKTIAEFWNNLSEGWRMIWGPHIHHGYYEENESLTPLEAQEKLIAKLIELLNLPAGATILDVGCGMGGSSLYLAKNHQATVTGITLSQKQVAIATQQAAENDIKQVSFKIEDALDLASFTDHSFDIIWSLESCEQFYDKALFLAEAYRVLKPGGKLMLATWCSDREEYEGNLAKKYRKLCDAFDLPYMPTIAHYQKLIEKQNFKIKKVLDWSTQTMKSWQIGISIARAYSILHLFRIGGLRGLRFVKQANLMRDAFQQNRVKYGVFLAEKENTVI